jgi:hypothetical protein
MAEVTEADVWGFGTEVVVMEGLVLVAIMGAGVVIAVVVGVVLVLQPLMNKAHISSIANGISTFFTFISSFISYHE